MWIRASCLVLIVLLVYCAGCGGSKPITQVIPSETITPAASGWPAALPVDKVQPWEALDDSGCVIPDTRALSCVNADSIFGCGIERAASSLVGVSDNGEAVRMVSGDAGSGDVTWAYWRLTLGGVQPGVVSADVNLLPMSDGAQSEYYLGLSDYGAEQWVWHGPFSESHTRLCVPAGGYLSALGNLFICVIACDGSTIDVVGAAANVCDSSDSDAPAAPTGLTAAAIAGGLELSWDNVDAADLAGYRIYYSANWFLDNAATGLMTVPCIEGTTHRMLPVTGQTYVRISAVDVSGNESPLSEIASATPLAGAWPDVRLTASQPSGMLNEEIALTATGADSYDWDLDGDGIYDVIGDATGLQQVNTTRAGIIRPALRGSTGGGECVGCGGVSVIVGTNIPPTAALVIGPGEERGNPPHTVNFDAGGSSDTDGSILEYVWDFDGDGDYDEWSASAAISHTYTMGGSYTAAVRVEDDGFGRDSATVAIEVNFAPVADLAADVTSGDAPLTVNFDAGGSSDADGTIDD